jgi:carboxyl-terminal processing protease
MEQSLKAKNLIIDLRFNGGGAILNLMHLSGYFLDSRVSLGYMLDKRALSSFEREAKAPYQSLSDLIPYSNFPLRPSKRDAMYKGNVIVLINAGSGSASEIFTAALRDQWGRTVDASGTISISSNARFSVVGSPSAGAVLFSTIVTHSTGFTVQYPLADYLTPSGLRLEGNPVQPDVLVDANKLLLPNQRDEPLETALLLVKRFTYAG